MKRIAFAALLSLLAAGAGAEPMKCIDASGKVRYIDSSMIGAAKCEPVKDAMNVVAPQAPAPTQSRASQDPAAPADTGLAEAEARLADAKSKLAEQEAIREGGERNYTRVQERLKPYQEAVERAEKELQQRRSER